MFTLPAQVIKALSFILKSLPYILIICVTIFVVTKLQSCSVFGPTKVQLEQAVEKKDIVIKEVQNANKDLADTIVEIKKSNNITVDVIDKSNKKEKSIIAKKIQIENKVKKQIEEVKVVNLDSTIRSEEIKQTKISTIQIESIWDTYESTIKQTESQV
jgi:predicted secreted Zn-dependent protease